MNVNIVVGSGLLIVFANAGCRAAHSEETEPFGARIAWYGTLDAGLAEAQRSGRPILLISGAPQCLGVPGIW